MQFTSIEWWTAIHGMAFGFGFILFFTVARALVLTLQSNLLTPV